MNINFSPKLFICFKQALQLKRVLLVSVLMVFVVLLSNSASASQTIAMNMSTINETPDRKEGQQVKRYLPPEVAKSDIVDTGGMQLRFDESRSSLYLFDEVDLDANESKVYRVILRDIWQITNDEVEQIRSQIKARLEYLQDTEDAAAGKVLAADLAKNLDVILEKQTQISESNDIAARIEVYRLNIKLLNEIRAKVLVMGDFVKEARWFSSATEDAGILKMLVKAKNPMDEIQENVELTRYLPRGVSADQVVQAEGFTVQFDPARDLFYVTQTLTLEPLAEYEGVILLKNIWLISDKKLSMIDEKAKDLQARLKDSQYEETGAKIVLEIEALAGQVRQLQEAADSPLDIISNFALNIKRLNGMEEGLDQLRELVLEVEHKVPQTVPYYVKPATPDISTTWKFIYGVIGFLTVLGVLFFLLWAGQSKARMNKKIVMHPKA